MEGEGRKKTNNNWMNLGKREDDGDWRRNH